MTTSPTLEDIEDFLLGLVARDRQLTIDDIREESRRCPHEPPWSSEDFVHYQQEIEEHFGLDFDDVEIEKVQRDVAMLSTYIHDLLVDRVAESA